MPRAYTQLRVSYAAAELRRCRAETQAAKPGTSGRKASQRRVQASSKSPGTPPGSGLAISESKPEVSNHMRQAATSEGYATVSQTL